MIGSLEFLLIGAVADVWFLASLEKPALILGAIWFVIGIVYLCWITRLFLQAPPEVVV